VALSGFTQQVSGGARWIRLLTVLAIVHGVALALILYTPITEWCAQPLYVPPAPVPHADAIVVLEAWAFDDGTLNESGVNRALLGMELFHQRIAPTVVVSGARPNGARTGSALRPMTHILVRGGVPFESIVVEDRSSNTHDSAVHVAALARTRGWTRVVLVTDASHVKRASLAFRKQGLEVAPAQTLFWKVGGATAPLRVERVGTLMHEYGGLLYYWWRGWI
jgi:uncharacterized SAM-binding protein YcdF (DUF218 family)